MLKNTVGFVTVLSVALFGAISAGNDQAAASTTSVKPIAASQAGGLVPTTPTIVVAKTVTVTNPPKQKIKKSTINLAKKVHASAKKQAVKHSNTYDSTRVTGNGFKTKTYSWAVDYNKTRSYGLVDDGTDAAIAGVKAYRTAAVKKLKASGLKKRGKTFSYKNQTSYTSVAYYTNSKHSCAVYDYVINNGIAKVGIDCASAKELKKLQKKIAPKIKNVTSKSLKKVSRSGGGFSSTSGTTGIYRTQKIKMVKPDAVYLGSGCKSGSDFTTYRHSKGWSYQAAKNHCKTGS